MFPVLSIRPPRADREESVCFPFLGPEEGAGSLDTVGLPGGKISALPSGEQGFCRRRWKKPSALGGRSEMTRAHEEEGLISGSSWQQSLVAGYLDLGAEDI